MVRVLAPCAYPESHSHTYWRLKAEHANPRFTCGICHPPVAFRRVCFLDTRAEGYWHFGQRVEIEVGGWKEPVPPPTGTVESSDAYVIGSGRAPVMTLAEATALFERWKSHEFGWVRARILTLARIHGEYHGDMIAGIEVSSPNIIGAAMNALANQGLIEKLNREGEVDHRMSAIPTNRRKSHVWRLTTKGKVAAAHLRQSLGGTDRLPGPKRKDAFSGDLSKDGTTIQGVLGP